MDCGGEEARALDEWASADPNRMTIREALAEGRRLRGLPLPDDVGAVGRPMTRSATISGEPIGVVRIRCELSSTSALPGSVDCPRASRDRNALGYNFLVNT
jgi:hypothetical protein